jgi:hypothetical protein
LQTVYSGSGNSPLWSRDGTATRQAQALLLELQNAQVYGLGHCIPTEKLTDAGVADAGLAITFIY